MDYLQLRVGEIPKMEERQINSQRNLINGETENNSAI